MESNKNRSAFADTFTSLRVRNFRLFFMGQMISQVGSWLRMIAQALLVLEITDSGVAVGIVTACQFLPMLLFGMWFGVLIDRSDKRRLLLVVQGASMLVSVAFALVAFRPEPHLGAVYLLALVGGVCTAIDNPARRAFLPEMVPSELVQNASSLNGAMLALARVVGPALAGLLVTTVGYGWCFLGDSVSFIPVMAGLAAMDPSMLHRSEQTQRARGQIRDGIRYFHSVRALWAGLVMMAIIGTLAFNFQVVLPLFATRTLGGSDVDFTLLYSCLSVGSLCGALWIARRPSIELGHVVASAFGYGVAMVLMALMPTLALAFAAAVLVGGASMIFMTTSASLLQLHADPTMRGRGLALQAMVFLGSAPIGGPIVGYVCEMFGARVGLVLGGVSCIAAAAWGARSRDERPVRRNVTDLDETMSPSLEM